MKRPALAWATFSAVLMLGIAVMLFFTLKILQLEQSMADSQAHAALEENIRLALWRMDSAAALLQRSATNPPFRSNSGNRIQQQQSVAQRYQPEFQQELNANEMQLREALNSFPATDWQRMEPTLVDRIKDILPGATLEPAAPDANGSKDERRLATIPARLVVPASALPATGLAWNTPVRVSLMIAWGCALVAAAATAQLLGATLSLSARRGAFASAVTHELRTPLTTFRMYAEMLSNGMVTDESSRQEYLQTLLAESDRLGHLIENVLAYSRLENRLAPRRANDVISLEQLIQHALPTLRRRTEQAGLPLEINLPDNAAELMCRTDPVAVDQILINLTDNACKYGQTPITLSAAPTTNGVEIRVADRGPGVARDRADRLFQAFSKSRTDAVPGIGLGLFVSRQLARNLDGDLEYRRQGQGTMFALTLPAEPASTQSRRNPET